MIRFLSTTFLYHQEISMESDPLRLNENTMDVVEVKRRAIQGVSNPK